jgi:ABC-type Na+ transport system ATPase subunit NatA
MEGIMLSVKNLSFSYTKKPFIKNMNFNVDKGEIFGFLGPSGAGKSTLQKILTGLITSYTGSVRLGGVECCKHDNSFYEKIGVDFEYSTLYEKLSARQNLEFFASLYNKKQKNIEELSIQELFAQIGLQHDTEKKVSEYSKGMKSRLNFLKALLHDPEIIFLDEPTSGLDPSNSRLMKGFTGIAAFFISVIVALSKNKVEGMAVGKFASLLNAGALIPFFCKQQSSIFCIDISFVLDWESNANRNLSSFRNFNFVEFFVGCLFIKKTYAENCGLRRNSQYHSRQIVFFFAIIKQWKRKRERYNLTASWELKRITLKALCKNSRTIFTSIM